MFICKICGQEFCNNKSLSWHIKSHGISIQEYYDTFNKKENEGVCVICGNETKYTGLSNGYRETCSFKCSGILKRKRLKNNQEKYEKFIEKVKFNQSKIWKNREQTGEKSLIIAKTATKIRKQVENMSKDERIARYGWMDKLSKEEKNKKVKEILNKSLFNWWNNATEEDKNLLYKKRGISNRKIYTEYELSIIREYDLYSKEVRHITEWNYRRYKYIINPNNLKRGKKLYHIDHIVSIYDGFKHNILPEIIASPFNLQMLNYRDNYTKNKKSDITVEELIEKCHTNFTKENMFQETQKNT